MHLHSGCESEVSRVSPSALFCQIGSSVQDSTGRHTKKGDTKDMIPSMPRGISIPNAYPPRHPGYPPDDNSDKRVADKCHGASPGKCQRFPSISLALLATTKKLTQPYLTMQEQLLLYIPPSRRERGGVSPITGALCAH